MPLFTFKKPITLNEGGVSCSIFPSAVFSNISDMRPSLNLTAVTTCSSSTNFGSVKRFTSAAANRCSSSPLLASSRCNSEEPFSATCTAAIFDPSAEISGAKYFDRLVTVRCTPVAMSSNFISL